jgi:hypothetical protein
MKLIEKINRLFDGIEDTWGSFSKDLPMTGKPVLTYKEANPQYTYDIWFPLKTMQYRDSIRSRNPRSALLRLINKYPTIDYKGRIYTPDKYEGLFRLLVKNGDFRFTQGIPLNEEKYQIEDIKSNRWGMKHIILKKGKKRIKILLDKFKGDYEVEITTPKGKVPRATIMNESTDEQEKYFEERTQKHIALVNKAIEKIAHANPEFKEFDSNELIENGKKHDAAKLQEPERTPYISITWRHKLEKEKDEHDPINDKGYQRPGLLDKKEENDATLHHITTNSHHPEYWLADKSEANINSKDRDKSDHIINASKMDNLSVAEMCADWQAMAEELQKNTALEWYEKQKDKRWRFSESQDKLIRKILAVLGDK